MQNCSSKEKKILIFGFIFDIYHRHKSHQVKPVNRIPKILFDITINQIITYLVTHQERIKNNTGYSIAKFLWIIKIFTIENLS